MKKLQHDEKLHIVGNYFIFKYAATTYFELIIQNDNKDVIVLTFRFVKETQKSSIPNIEFCKRDKYMFGLLCNDVRVFTVSSNSQL